jgi:hypothetical protein
MKTYTITEKGSRILNLPMGTTVDLSHTPNLQFWVIK